MLVMGSRRRRAGVASTLHRRRADVARTPRASQETPVLATISRTFSRAPVSRRYRADVALASRRRRSNSARIFARSSARIARNTGISFLSHHTRSSARIARNTGIFFLGHHSTGVARTPSGFSRAPPRASQETPAFPFSATIHMRVSAHAHFRSAQENNYAVSAEIIEGVVVFH